jgi:hypothetical protein
MTRSNVEVCFELAVVKRQTNPWLVRTRLQTDSVVPSPVITVYKTIQIVPTKTEMTVGEALDRQLVDPEDPELPSDVDELIVVEHDVEQEIAEPVREIRIFTTKRTRMSSHYSDVTPDHAYATAHPTSFIPKEFVEVYEQYIETIKGRLATKVSPKLIVFLSPEVGRSRANFLVLEAETLDYLVSDEEGNVGHISLKPNQRPFMFQRKAILFFPSNIDLTDLYTGGSVF